VPDSGISENVDAKVVAGFGAEWSRFDQRSLPAAEREAIFNAYFSIFPWESLPPNAIGFDAGCGTGRWAMLVAPRVGHLHCIDPSSALDVARTNLRDQTNCSFHNASVDGMPLGDASMDFGYSLGVLHHVPDTQRGLAACTRKLKPGAPFLLYLYYAFDNRPAWFRAVWRASDIFRRAISRSPSSVRNVITDAIAASVYFPLARMAYVLEKAGMEVSSIPLSAYRDKSFYSMRTDALDRFGTRLEQRFTRTQIAEMMERAGLEGIRFSPHVPYWCAVGYRRSV
jgi:ubiquinone/menaquinone biosynthesis C-methylase UbiE